MTFRYEVDYPNRKVYAIGYSKFGKRYDGVATCSPNDVFDVKIGKELARKRALAKQLKRIEEANEEKLASALALVDGLMNRSSKIRKQMEKISNELEGF